MTEQQLHLFNGIGLVVLVVVAVLTRATARRIAGALAGGAAFGVVALGIIALGEQMGWWHMAITWEPYFLTLLVDRLRPVCVRLSHHLADRPPVRLAWTGRVRRGGGNHRPTAGLLVHGALPGMGRLRTRDRAHARGLRNLRRDGGTGTRGDAAGRRTGSGGPVARRPWEAAEPALPTAFPNERTQFELRPDRGGTENFFSNRTSVSARLHRQRRNSSWTGGIQRFGPLKSRERPSPGPSPGPGEGHSCNLPHFEIWDRRRGVFLPVLSSGSPS